MGAGVSRLPDPTHALGPDVCHVSGAPLDPALEALRRIERIANPYAAAGHESDIAICRIALEAIRRIEAGR